MENTEYDTARQKENKQINQSVNPHHATQQEPASSDMIRTAGEKVFDEITYRGVNWILNSAVGVTFNYVTSRTEFGEKRISAPMTGFFRRTLRPFFKNPERLRNGAEWGKNFVSIMVGGFAIIPFIEALERNKKAVVKSFDKAIYGEEKVQNDPIFEKAYAEIDREPEQSFGIGMVTRFLAIAPILAAVVTFPQQLNKVYDFFGGISKWTAENVLRIKATSLKNKIKPGEDGTKINDWDWIHNKIGFDYSLTLVYAYLHEYLYKGFSDLFGKKKEADTAAPPMQPDTLTLTEGSPVDRESASSPLAAEAKQATQETAKPEQPKRHISTEEVLHYETALKQPEAPNLSIG